MKDSPDILHLKKRMVSLIQREEYELASRIKQWIIQMNGNPDISNLLESNRILKN